MGMANIEMVWELTAKASWCHVSGQPSQPAHAITEGNFNGTLRLTARDVGYGWSQRRQSAGVMIGW